MKKERQALSEFLNRQQISYCNPDGIVFYRIADGSLFVAAGYPGVEQTTDISLDFFQQFEDLIRFMALLHISDPECLDNVVKDDLFSLYKDELLDIVCTLKGRGVRKIRFRKLGGMIWAISNRNKMQLVRIPIHQPEDFIAYTMRYYKVINN